MIVSLSQMTRVPQTQHLALLAPPSADREDAKSSQKHSLITSFFHSVQRKPRREQRKDLRCLTVDLLHLEKSGNILWQLIALETLEVNAPEKSFFIFSP